MSDLMRKFLSAWLEWAENVDAIDPNQEKSPFSSEFGLCMNLGDYCYSSGQGAMRRVLDNELYSMFKRDDLNGIYPFNKNSEGYEDETYHRMTHRNPIRLAWVRKQLESA